MSVFERLTAKQVENIKKPGRVCDGRGLWLQVSRVRRQTTKAWVLRYTLDGRARHMGLGAYPDVKLAAAREKAEKARLLLSDGIDPLEEKRKARATAALDAARTVTFRYCAEHYLRAHEAAWRNPVHRKQWASTLDTYAFPVIGDLPVAEVDTGLVMKCLEPIWRDKTETATRVRGRIERILGWAKTRGFRSGDNPARWHDHLDQLLPSPKKLQKTKLRHHPAVPYDEMAGFMSELRKRDGVSARALEVLALTALRTSELIGARWSEIDTKKKLWIVPESRMKMRIEHRVPLSDRVLEILNALPSEDDSDFVFIGAQKGKPISNMSMLELMRGMRPGYVPHGLRASFRTWASEETNFPREICEVALAHAVGNKVEQAYQKGDLLEKRRRLMQDWATYCSRPAVVPSDKVPSLAQARRNRRGG
jgi:integrase